MAALLVRQVVSHNSLHKWASPWSRLLDNSHRAATECLEVLRDLRLRDPTPRLHFGEQGMDDYIYIRTHD